VFDNDERRAVAGGDLGRPLQHRKKEMEVRRWPIEEEPRGGWRSPRKGMGGGARPKSDEVQTNGTGEDEEGVQAHDEQNGVGKGKNYDSDDWQLLYLSWRGARGGGARVEKWKGRTAATGACARSVGDDKDPGAAACSVGGVDKGIRCWQASPDRQQKKGRLTGGPHTD
jgi:hypothetical protein